ncbi:ScbA/BarX family gamma-butyrolactone biosynthesis protein [Streptomyces griseoflavus]|uniref:ScbA/BarX family gamma-butyrolactone biosynthesis protein n=1 Tax=Streptomyces griseoflavus TaxID=35619 RepID=UPI0033A97DFB
MPQPDSSSAPREDQTGQRASPANAAGPAPARTLVTPALAHRPRAEDVFPVSWVRLADDRFRVTAHWPAGHSFFGPLDGRHQDPMIVGETLRQTSMALAHAEFGAPADTHFVMHDLEVSTDPAALLLADAAEPVTVDVVCSEVRRRGRGLNGMRTTMEFRRAGLLVARGTGSTGCVSPAVYRRLRASRPTVADSTRIPLPAPVEPRRVGRHRAQDVVLAPSDRPGRWLLRVDTRHPVLFPRPNDHVPGMVLFEAARQAAAAASGRLPFLLSDFSVLFSRYAELDGPCLIDTEVLDKGEDEVTVRVSGRQDDEPVFDATLTCAPTAPVRSLP